MLLMQDKNIAQYVIKQVTSHSVKVNDVIYTESLIVMPHKIILPWRPTILSDLTIQDFECLFCENRDVILLGVGESGGRLSPELNYALLTKFTKKLVVECMSLSAAARTYSILSAEGRNVAAALILN